MNNICIQCGESREAIKTKTLICGTVNYFGELECEWPRHRFKPYSEKEIAARLADEMEYVKQMGEMADFYKQTT